jgi:hypothetical protein
VNSSCVFRRKAGDDVNFYNPTVRVCEDYDLWLRLAQIGDVVVLPTQDLVQYRKVRQGVSTERISTASMAAIADSRMALAQTLDFSKLTTLVLQRTWEMYLQVKFAVKKP